jgi:hypothetical protein
MRRGGVQDFLHLLRREHRHIIVILDLHLLELLRGRHLFGGQAVLRATVGKEHLHADQHRIARTGRHLESPQPRILVGSGVVGSVRLEGFAVRSSRVEQDGVPLVVPHQAERVAAFAHGFYRPQCGPHATGKRVSGLGVEEIAKEQRLVTGRRNESLASLGVAKPFHQGAELVETAVDVGDDVIVDLVIHRCGAWRKQPDLEMEGFLDYMTSQS